MSNDLPLWRGAELPPIKSLSREDDPPTSKAAAKIIGPRRSRLLGNVLRAFRKNGMMTDEELEQLPQFARYAPATLRRRRTTLYQMGRLSVVGTKRNSRGVSMTIWDLTYRRQPRDTHPPRT